MSKKMALDRLVVFTDSSLSHQFFCSQIFAYYFAIKVEKNFCGNRMLDEQQ